ncbi:hypothetical protein G6O67_001914 [Ophiocordyceps sinensis]|uniref:Integrase catalytic domain-containing protein n=1 Tax=Ophiocordyceps sinensis TaxID=72228 RepID=A0A8H4PT39_9HYPO|nr:hypothetical protein G6O67_001914 [Ophiocordyceps sinensis]
MIQSSSPPLVVLTDHSATKQICDKKTLVKATALAEIDKLCAQLDEQLVKAEDPREQSRHHAREPSLRAKRERQMPHSGHFRGKSGLVAKRSLSRLLLLADWGMPSTIISDRDRRFNAEIWRSLWKSFGTKIAMTTAYHPQADGLAERRNQTVETALRMAYIEGGVKPSTPTVLPHKAVIFALRFADYGGLNGSVAGHLAKVGQLTVDCTKGKI